ncbi:hypothetical protein JWJ90_13670 [Desulfobulbus rhabdoformis]|uniref:hypothetical protein n=1 Tax=Desulfobulbus rhabdoformis TaxID=34032 RepID=UPI0019637CCB|nr:hypothetical protein [Desulfobulbus rhabdoformis]MBM9615328.1 hypothetical protein [Desulfobulbus rhabdoformis]
MAAMTAAERQQRYRERALHDPDGALLTRLQVMIESHAAANLERICQQEGWAKRQAVEVAINEIAKALQCNSGE